MKVRLNLAIAMLSVGIVLFSCTGVEGVPFQVLPQGIQSVNGSSETMGCTSPLVVRNGVMICELGAHAQQRL